MPAWRQYDELGARLGSVTCADVFYAAMILLVLMICVSGNEDT